MWKPRKVALCLQRWIILLRTLRLLWFHLYFVNYYLKMYLRIMFSVFQMTFIICWYRLQCIYANASMWYYYIHHNVWKKMTNSHHSLSVNWCIQLNCNFHSGSIFSCNIQPVNYNQYLDVCSWFTRKTQSKIGVWS